MDACLILRYKFPQSFRLGPPSVPSRLLLGFSSEFLSHSFNSPTMSIEDRLASVYPYGEGPNRLDAATRALFCDDFHAYEVSVARTLIAAVQQHTEGRVINIARVEWKENSPLLVSLPSGVSVPTPPNPDMFHFAEITYSDGKSILLLFDVTHPVAPFCDSDNRDDEMPMDYLSSHALLRDMFSLSSFEVAGCISQTIDSFVDFGLLGRETGNQLLRGFILQWAGVLTRYFRVNFAETSSYASDPFPFFVTYKA